MKKQRGFTLIELLIVVVIIGVLASLILPRFLSQPEKAVIAEANMVLGAVTRAQNIYVDSGAGTTWVAASTTAADWLKLGMQIPSTAKFTYACTTALCTATRAAGGGNYAGSGITVTYVAGGDATWDCTTPGAGSKKYAALPNGGCTTA